MEKRTRAPLRKGCFWGTTEDPANGGLIRIGPFNTRNLVLSPLPDESSGFNGGVLAVVARSGAEEHFGDNPKPSL